MKTEGRNNVFGALWTFLIAGVFLTLASTSKAQLVFEFTDNGTGTLVTGSGAMTTARSDYGIGVGYGQTYGAGGSSATYLSYPFSGPTPPHLLFPFGIFYGQDASSTLNVNGVLLKGFSATKINAAVGNAVALLNQTGSSSFGDGPNFSASGSASFNLPFSNFASLVGQQVDIFQDGTVIFCFGPCQPPNQPPSCDAGPDQTIEATGVLTEVTLDGTGSSDPDGDPLSFAWSVPGESEALILDPTAASTVSFFPLRETVVALTVDDGNGGASSCNVTVTVKDETDPDVYCLIDPEKFVATEPQD